MRPARLATATATVAVVAAAALAGPAAAASITPTVTEMTAPAPMPLEFAGNIYNFGTAVPAGAPIPPGATVLKVVATVFEHQTETMPVTCPRGALATDVGTDPAAQVSFGFAGGDQIGKVTPELIVTDPPFNGTATAYVLCVPHTLTPGAGWSNAHAKRAPVSFPRVPIGRTTPATLRRGAKLPAGSKLLTEVFLPVSGQASVTTLSCGRGLTPTLAATSVPAVKAVVSGPVVFFHAGKVKSGLKARGYVLCVKRTPV